MAEKVLTFNGRAVGGPNGGGTGMIIVKVPPFYGDGITIDGRTYPTVIIGNQEWMAENLDLKFTGMNFRDGVDGNILHSSFDRIPEAAYYNYDESTYGAEGNKYGLLYNWDAVYYLSNHSQEAGIPAGWHVPTKEEWETLISAVSPEPALKLKTTNGWTAGAGTDMYAFSAFPVGKWEGGVGFYNMNKYVAYYTSSYITNEFEGVEYYYGYYCSMIHGSPSPSRVYVDHGNTFNCYSLRLVKDLA